MTWYEKDIKETDITQLNETFKQLGFTVVAERFPSQGFATKESTQSKVYYQGKEFVFYEEGRIVLYHGILKDFPADAKNKIKTALSDPKIRLEDRV